MDEFDKIFADLEAVRNEPNSFVYKHPITGETKEGIGDAPLNWGEYPSGVEENSIEANDYDAFRSQFYPLPHIMIEGSNGEEDRYSLTSPEAIAVSRNMPEGSQLTDRNWISASRLLHDYFNPNAKPYGSVDQSKDVGYGITIDGSPVENEQLENANEYAEWGVNFMTAFDYNFSALAINTARLSNAPPEVAKAMYYLMETADREGMTLKNFGKGTLAMATDPFNLGVLATFGIGVAGKYTGQQVTKMGFKELLKNIVISAPTKASMATGVEAGFLTMADNLARQNVKVDAKVQEEFDPVEAGVAGTIGTVLGDRATAGMASVLEGGRRMLVGAGKEADNYLANNSGGTTLNMGTDPTVPIAQGLSSIGKALDETTPKVEQDYLGFYSKALEVTKTLKQEKGSGQQFKGMLIKNGVKQDELDWLGLDEVLSKDKVTKAEIEQHINDNRIRVVEETAMDDGKSKEMDWTYRNRESMTPEEAYGDDYIPSEANEIMEDFNSNLSDLDVPMTIDRASQIAFEQYNDNPISRLVDANTGYTITGNDSVGYSIFKNREDSSSWKNSLNNLNTNNDMETTYSLNEAQIQAESMAMYRGDLNPYEGSARWKDHTVDQGETGDNYQETKLILDNSKEGDFYEEAHYEDANILASIRHTDRIADDGSKVFFVEEIQSDWGQQGRRDGFKLTNKQRDDLEFEIDDLLLNHEKEINSYTIKQGDERIPFADWFYAKRKEMALTEQAKIMADGKDPNALSQSFMSGIKAGNILGNVDNSKYSNYQTSIEKIEKMNLDIHKAKQKRYNEVPQAPFVTDTNKWTALTIKRLMAKAEDEGYDSIAFSAGIIHANRWNNQGLKTYYDKVLPSVINKVVGKIDNSSIGTVTMKKGIRSSELDDFPQLAIRLTPKVKETVKKGQALFSAGGLVGASMLSSQGENSEVMNGNT
tara:strand:+ start:16471 stop:19272 length:2802 start_codon:yes stop_codon:yes gene_type:complete